MVIALAIGPFEFVKVTGGEETDRGFLVRRPVWSTDSVLVFEGGRFPLRWLASRKKKKVAAWNSGGAWAVRYVDGISLFGRCILNSISWCLSAYRRLPPCEGSSGCVLEAAHGKGDSLGEGRPLRGCI